MKSRNSPRVPWSKSFALRAVALGGLACGQAAFAGTWTPLANAAPGPVNTMLLLSDGSVMCARNDASSTATISNAWFRLTPNAQGSYINGTWTTLPNAHHTRLYYPSQVLRDGRVFVAGGEYGNGGPHAEVFDPLTNVWTQTDPPPALWSIANDDFYDCNSEMLPDGKVLLMPVFPHTSAIGLRYDPATNVWSNAGALFRGTYQDEASWVKLADDSILTIDPFGTFSERYIAATNTWINDGIVPVSLYDPFGFELGAALLLPNGKAFFLGSTGHTAIYTPSGSTSPGTWIAGPDIPGAHGTPDAPAAMMITGKILCAVSPIPTSGNHFPSPTTFYEYDYVANSFTSVGAPTGASEAGACYGTAMLQLPDGSVLFSHLTSQLYAYQPTGSAIAAGKPVITSVTANGDGSYHLVGLKLNGISAGASYGDDLQMNTNYPLVRLSNGSGNVWYARTYNWSSTGVQTGATPVSTEFRPPASLPPGTFSLVVVTNGFVSDPVTYPPTPIMSSMCFGDGLDPNVTTPCPCANTGAPGNGCAHSTNAAGAHLTMSGNPNPDTIVLTGTGMPDASTCIYLQGDALDDAVFGDGVRCAGGGLLRLKAKLNLLGGSSYPEPGDPTVSDRGSVTPGSGAVRYYQTYYRNAAAAFCPPATFNVTNGVQLVW